MIHRFIGMLHIINYWIDIQGWVKAAELTMTWHNSVSMMLGRAVATTFDTI